MLIVDIALNVKTLRNVNIYEESPRGAASGLTRCNFFRLQTSLLSLFHVLLGQNFNMLVSDLGAVNWLWPFMVLGQIYGR